jgi:hypothetical protein
MLAVLPLCHDLDTSLSLSSLYHLYRNAQPNVDDDDGIYHS